MRRASSSATSRRAPPNDSSTAGVPRLRAINSRHASVISVSASYPRHDAEPSDAREHDTHGSANCPEGACHMRELPELPYGSRIDDPGGRRWPSLPFLNLRLCCQRANARTGRRLCQECKPHLSPISASYAISYARCAVLRIPPGLQRCKALSFRHPRPYVHKSCPFRAFRPPAFHEIIPRVISLLLRSTPFHSWQFHFLSSCPPSSPLRGPEISDCPASPTMFYSRDSARLPHCLSRCLSRRPFS